MSVKSQSVRGTAWAMIGLLLVVAGPILYGLLLDLPLMRATGAPAFALIRPETTAFFPANTSFSKRTFSAKAMKYSISDI